MKNLFNSTSLFNAFRKAMNNTLLGAADYIAPSQIKVVVPPGTKSLTTPNRPQHEVEQVANPTMYRGQFHLSHLDMIYSTYLKNAVCQLGAWSSMAKAFNLFQKNYGKRTVNEAPFLRLVEEFHAWNAATDEAKQMSEDDIILTADRIAEVKVAKGSKETDAIIAKIRKISVEQLKADRLAKAEKATATRKDMLISFVAALGQPTGSDIDPEMPVEKVASKALQTLEFLATQNWDPTFIATECLLIQGDLDNLEAITKKPVHTTHEEGTLCADAFTAPVDARKFGDERPDVETSSKYAPRVSAEDVNAFLEWQAAQQTS